MRCREITSCPTDIIISCYSLRDLIQQRFRSTLDEVAAVYHNFLTKLQEFAHLRPFWARFAMYHSKESVLTSQ